MDHFFCGSLFIVEMNQPQQWKMDEHGQFSSMIYLLKIVMFNIKVPDITRGYVQFSLCWQFAHIFGSAQATGLFSAFLH